VLTYELRLGVTGHRDIRDETGVSRAIGRLLQRIDETLNHQSVAPLTWTVVSALARGADRLFTDRVLNDKQGRLEVVTPFHVTEYVNDFAAEADRAEFERMFGRASRVDQLNGDRRSGRAAAYLSAGERLVNTCEIVVAIWDGRASVGGGTGDVVEYAVRHERVVIWLDSENPAAPPRLIRAVTYGDDGRMETSGCREFPSTDTELSAGYHQQSRYCLDPAVSPAVCAITYSEQRHELLEAAQAAGVDPDNLDSLGGPVLRQYVRADALAQYYQRRDNWLVAGVPYLAATAVMVAAGQVLFFPRRPQLILIEIAAMTLAAGLWWWSRHQAWHEKWLHDRYLAERLRAATFTTLLGLPPTSALRDETMPFYPGPKHWLTQAVNVLTRATRTPVIPLEPLRRFIVSEWLEIQRDHHARSASKKLRAVRRRHQLGFALFWLTLLMAVLHLADVGHPLDNAAVSLLRIDLWITFLALVLPAWAGAIHAVTSQLELERLAERSTQMVRVLDQAVDRAKSTRSIEDLRDVCEEAGALMAHETHEWWVLLSFQRPRLHV
jgi:hypothetical protein